MMQMCLLHDVRESPWVQKVKITLSRNEVLQEKNKHKHKSNNKTLSSSKASLKLTDVNGWLSKRIVF